MSVRNCVLFLVMAVFCLVLIRCKKDSTADLDGCAGAAVPAKIIGQDYRLCACCGGWFIELGEDTVRAFAFPDEYIMDSLATFPINVCLSYEDYSGACAPFGDLIIVNSIEEQ